MSIIDPQMRRFSNTIDRPLAFEVLQLRNHLEVFIIAYEKQGVEQKLENGEGIVVDGAQNPKDGRADNTKDSIISRYTAITKLISEIDLVIESFQEIAETPILQ